MASRFADMKKIPDQPAARLMADGQIKLQTPLDSPASASVQTVLEELEAKKEWIDMMRLLGSVLPAREAVWWACVAARDLFGKGKETPCLKASEAWVFDPSDDNRAKVKEALDAVEMDDDTELVATAAYYAPGNMGLDELADFEAPPGAVSACAIGMNGKTLDVAEDPVQQLNWIIDRAVDIARGGNGQVPCPDIKYEPEPMDDEEEEA